MANSEEPGLLNRSSRFILNKIIDYPVYASALGIGTYLAYRRQKNKDNKEKEIVQNVDPKFDKNKDILTGKPESKYDVGK
jgi:hypothetical protein